MITHRECAEDVRGGRKKKSLDFVEARCNLSYTDQPLVALGVLGRPRQRSEGRICGIGHSIANRVDEC